MRLLPGCSVTTGQAHPTHKSDAVRRPPPDRRRWLSIVVAGISLVAFGAAWMHVGGGTGTRIIAAANGGIDPLSYLAAEFDETGCVRTPLAVGDGFFVICENFTANTSRSGVARVVSLYGPGNPVLEEYTGALPRSLTWGNSPKAVIKAIGRPSRISDLYGPPTFVYMFTGERYGSLELQFDARDHLVRINAGLTR